MNSGRWRKIEELCRSAGQREGNERSAFLDQACRGDAAMRGEVEALLAQHTPSALGVASASWAAATVPLSGVASGPLPAGARLGPYRIENVLGAGGMGEVYRAVDTRLGRNVAIKVSREQFSARFEREARTISSLNHPNICTLFDVGPNYLVTELVEGETLRDLLKRAPTVERSIEIARQILEALRAAHRAGIVHRDLKPANVMVRFDGYVKVLDFGLAKRMPASSALPSEDTASMELTQPGQILGTVPYMSPEQILGQEADGRSDLFAFGIMLHEMVTGEHPWPRKSVVDLMHAILHDAPPPIEAASGVSAALAPVVRKLLEKNPAERYALAETVLEALAPRPAGAVSVTETPAKPLKSIAVLPFIFLNEVPESRSLSLGFADALITVLASLEDIRVLPTSAILNHAAGADPAQACRDLGVHNVLQGNVQKRGSQWRVSMQLFDAAAQKTAFSEKHDFQMENVFDVQDEIGRRVVESLQSRLAPVAPKAGNRYSSEPEAYEAFMEGLRESYSNQEATLRSAIQHLTEAVERDPEFALAHATLSYSCMNMHIEFDPQYAWVEKAEHHCARALALDPALAEGHLARSWILWSPAKNFQHMEAIAAVEQVLAAQPNSERAHNRMASICMHIGRLEEARIAHEQAERSNPKTSSYNLEFILLYGGDFTRLEVVAEAHLKERHLSWVALMCHSLSPLYRGDFDVAGNRLAVALSHYPGEPMIVSLQGMLHARLHQTELALQCARKAVDSPRSSGHMHHNYHHVACIYALLGDTEKAMAWLERTVDTGFPCWPFFRIDPHLASLRETPAFQRLVAGLERKYSALTIQRL